jgi:hypothetical protein
MYIDRLSQGHSALGSAILAPLYNRYYYNAGFYVSGRAAFQGLGWLYNWCVRGQHWRALGGCVGGKCNVMCRESGLETRHARSVVAGHASPLMVQAAKGFFDLDLGRLYSWHGLPGISLAELCTDVLSYGHISPSFCQHYRKRCTYARSPVAILGIKAYSKCVQVAVHNQPRTGRC